MLGRLDDFIANIFLLSNVKVPHDPDGKPPQRSAARRGGIG